MNAGWFKRTIQEKDCPCCGVRFQPKNKHQKYCKNACYLATPINDKQRAARRANALRLHDKPATEHQREASRRNIRIAHSKFVMTPARLAAIRENQKLSIKEPTQRQLASLAAGRKLGTAANIAKQAWSNAVAYKRTPEGRAQSRATMLQNRKNGCKETGIERKVKALLVELGVRFIQEHQIKSVGWVDFFLPDHNAVVECDGHYWHSLPGNPEKDARRDAACRDLGYRVFRFGEKQINRRIESVKAELITL
jgi:very-short-patch-repair endonuclease